MSLKFLGGTAIILFVYAMFCWGLNNIMGQGGEIVKAFVYSGILATIFVLITFFSTVIVSARAKINFIKVFFVTLGIRFVVMLGMIIIILTKVSLDYFTFLVSLFILYFLFQIWEMFVIHRYLNQD